MQICSKCLKPKEDNNFSWCNSCRTKNNAEYGRTKNGLVGRIYSDQRGSSKTRGHRPPEYTKLALKQWLFSQTLFHELHEEWKQSGYKKRLVPSVDRKEDSIHYCMNNIQLMTWGENYDKGTLAKSKAVEVIGRDGISLGIFVSISEASRELDLDRATLGYLLKKGTKGRRGKHLGITVIPYTTKEEEN